MMLRSNWLSGVCLTLTLAVPSLAAAQDPPPTAPPQTSPAPVTSNPDVRLDPLQPDFNLAALPTNLRLPAHKMAFRVTHRFTRSLGSGDVGDLFNDFFGFDSGALIGLEFRYGLRPGTQVGIHRTSDKTIEIFGQQSIWTEKADGHPLSIDAIATVEGLNNFREVPSLDGLSSAHQTSGAFGLIVSRKAGKVASLYAEPLFVANSNPTAIGSNNTTMIGLGARVRIRPTTYLVGELTPRVGGYRPRVNQGSFGLEARAGGHTFQINFSNGFGTTLGQLAGGGVDNSSWYIGFNISRKFF
jgi:hypothetical protein